MPKTGYLEKTPGEKSSKRLYGSLFGLSAVGMGVIGFSIALFHPIGNERIVLEMPLIFGGICATLLTGGTIAESIKNGSLTNNIQRFLSAGKGRKC